MRCRLLKTSLYWSILGYKMGREATSVPSSNSSPPPKKKIAKRMRSCWCWLLPVRKSADLWCRYRLSQSLRNVTLKTFLCTLWCSLLREECCTTPTPKTNWKAIYNLTECLNGFKWFYYHKYKNRIFTVRNVVAVKLCFHRRLWFCS